MDSIKRKLIPQETERVYSPNQAFLPVTPLDNPNARVLVLSRAAYIRDPATGTMRRIGKPLNKHERRKLEALKCPKP